MTSGGNEPATKIERLSAQGLSGEPLGSPDDVVGRLLAVQAQDARGSRLTIRSRTQGLSAADVDSAFNDGSMVITWLNRGTLHRSRSEDYAWLHEVTAPRQVNFNLRRLEQEGVSPDQAEKGEAAIRTEIADQGPRTRAELRSALEGAGVPTAGQAFIHVLMYCSLRGLIVRGPMRGGEQQFVLVDEWLGERPPVDTEAALAELARRYLAGHGPAGERDLAKWAAITLGQARAGMKAIKNEVVDAGQDLIRLERSGVSEELPPPKLLGPFDPILHGWQSRDFLVPDERERSVVTTNGVFRPTILVDGQVAGIWRLAEGKIELQPFGEIGAAAAGALEEEMEDVHRFLRATDSD